MNFNKYHVSRNLFDFDAWYTQVSPTRCTVSKTGNAITITATGNDSYTGNGGLHVPVESGTEYTFHFTSDNDNSGSIYLFENGTVDSTHTHSFNNNNKKQVTFTTLSDTTFLTVRLGVYNSGNSITYSNIMLNTGSTPLPYEPYSSEVWHDIPHYIHNTSTDTITTLPAVLYPNAVTATVGLKGQMEQSSTPSPTTPIQPQECGERTGNLIDFNALKSAPSGRIPNSTYTYVFEHLLIIGVEPNTEYTMSSTGTGSTGGAAADNRSVYINGTGDNEVVFANHPITKTTGADGLLYVGFESSRPNAAQYLNGTAVITLNLGSTALPYEPYGVKIPISSASTTTPVYLGEAESTRRIKKLVLTGEEAFFRDREREGSWRFYSNALISAKDNTAICSHFENIGSDGVNNSDNIGFCIFYKAQFGCRCPKSIAATVADFKSYLAQQYAAGTPVTVWYVLAEPETGIVNEPLMKIGEYADEVSGISIPVTAGGDAISVDTTLQPSEVTVNYKGWHPVQNVHERDNGAWT